MQKYTIADWGVEFAFVRTHVGAEFDVANSFKSVVSNPSCRFFGAYGHFDLAAVACVDYLRAPYLVLLDCQIIESAPFRFFACRQGHSREKFERDIDSWPCAVFVLAKVHSAITRRDCGRARWAAAQEVQRKLPEAHVFLGLGYSELLIFSGGNNLSHLLTAITDLRMLRDSQNPALSLFSKTTTFAFVSCTKVHNLQDYQRLEGTVEPVITVSCEPPTERLIALGLQNPDRHVVHNIYGKSDILISWKDPISIMDLASFLTDFRQKWGPSGKVSKTSTHLRNLLGSAAQHGLVMPIEATSEPLPEQMTKVEEAQLFERLRAVEPHSLRAALSDLTLRLSACLHDPQLAEHFRDMGNVFPYLFSLTAALRTSNSSRNDAPFITAESVADLARTAINQRYAGLELNPETLAHARAPLLCDIRTIVSAATCIPHFIFDRLLQGHRASETWAGFVLFGGASSPQYLFQQILALPPSSLFGPIEEWWKITHEAAHGVFEILQVYEKLPVETLQYVANALHESGLDHHSLINELFANWFDWNYIFARDTEFYLQCIWKSWVRLPIVHKSKSQYLARGFAVFICPRLSEFVDLLRQRQARGARPWLQHRWDEFIQLLRNIPDMSAYLVALLEQEKENALKLTLHASRIIYFFEKSFEIECNVQGLKERLNPTYPTLKDHISALTEGEVITEVIPNPFRLHLELLRCLNSHPPRLATEIAYLFSLENTYVIARSSRVKS